MKLTTFEKPCQDPEHVLGVKQRIKNLRPADGHRHLIMFAGAFPCSAFERSDRGRVCHRVGENYYDHRGLIDKPDEKITETLSLHQMLSRWNDLDDLGFARKAIPLINKTLKSQNEVKLYLAEHGVN